MEATQRGVIVEVRFSSAQQQERNDDVINLLKFAPKETYIDDLMDGRLYMNAVGYYLGLPGEQGDPLETPLS